MTWNPHAPPAETEHGKKIERAEFLNFILEEHQAALAKSLGTVQIEFLDRAILSNTEIDFPTAYFHILLGALLVQHVPPAEAALMADHCARLGVDELKLRPEGGHA